MSYDTVQSVDSSLQDSTPFLPIPIVFTLSAASKVKELIEEEKNLNLKLRLFIIGGGCSGFQYQFAFEETIQPEDLTVLQEVDGLKIYLLVDMLSSQYLQGAEVDYRKDITGERFIIRNPNSKTTCGCGSSFAVE